METWPNFFIVGAPRAGTTSLYYYLKDCPEVYMSPTKEPRFFKSELYKPVPTEEGINLKGNKKKYLQLFSNVKDEKAIGEASPSYLRDPGTAILIHEVIPNAKIIIILRDPINRVFSHYLYLKSSDKEKRSFDKAVINEITKDTTDYKPYNVYLDASLYFEQVKRYQDIFGTNQVKILIFEEFMKEPEKNLSEVLEFLGINSISQKVTIKKYNLYGESRNRIFHYMRKSKAIRKFLNILPEDFVRKLRDEVVLKKQNKPKLSKEEMICLENYYREDVKKLQKLLERKLPWNWINNPPLN